MSIEALAWCSVVVMLGCETKAYVKEFRWYVRFGVIYVLVGDVVMFNFIFALREFYTRSGFMFTLVAPIRCMAYVNAAPKTPLILNGGEKQSLDSVKLR